MTQHKWPRTPLADLVNCVRSMLPMFTLEIFTELPGFRVIHDIPGLHRAVWRTRVLETLGTDCPRPWGQGTDLRFA